MMNFPKLAWERLREQASYNVTRYKRKYKGPEGCYPPGVVATGLYMSPKQVIILCREGKLEWVDGPSELRKPNGKKRTMWVKKDSLERYIAEHQAELSQRAIRLGALT